MDDLDKKESKKHNIFTNLNFVKNNKINYNYNECIHQVKNVTDTLENFIDLIEESIPKETRKKIKKSRLFNTDNVKRPMSAQIVRKRDKSFKNILEEKKEESKNKYLNSSIINNYNISNISKYKKKKYKLKTSKSMILDKNKNNNKINQRKLNFIKYGTHTQNSSSIIGNTFIRKENKDYTKIINEIFSKNKIFNSNTSTNKINNSSMITVCNPRNHTTKSKRPQSATIGHSSIKDYTYKKKYFKYIPSNNTSKNLSRSRYRSLTNIYFDSNNYSKLRPYYLMELIKQSNNIKNSYKKDLKNIYMTKNTKELMEIAKKEIKMKDPEYHKKQIFKNIIKVKKTLNYVNKMREEQKYKMDYFGPGNINNKGYIRRKNANLIRFCDQICHMKDEKFYMYQKLLNDLYPNLIKNVFKIKYKMSEREPINEKKMKENEKKIKKLILAFKKH